MEKRTKTNINIDFIVLGKINKINIFNNVQYKSINDQTV